MEADRSPGVRSCRGLSSQRGSRQAFVITYDGRQATRRCRCESPRGRADCGELAGGIYQCHSQCELPQVARGVPSSAGTADGLRVARWPWK